MKIKKEINNYSGTFFLEFEGADKKDHIDTQDILQKINDILEQATFHDLSTSIKMIRETLKDYDESTLNVQLSTNGLSMSATYKNAELVKLEYSLTISCKEEKFKWLIDSNGEENYEICKKINNEYATITPEDQRKVRETVEFYKNLSAENHKSSINKLAKYYEAFYGKKIDLSSSDKRIEIQCMVYILIYFGIDIGDYFDFCYHSDDQIPTSNTLDRVIDECANIASKEDLDINPEELTKVSAIANDVRSLTSSGYRMYQISQIIYALQYEVLPELINEFHTIGSNRIHSCIKRIELIKGKKS